MRNKLLCLALFCSLGAFAAPAQAVTYGLSENQDSMFSNPYFAPLNVKHVRLVVSYDVMTNTALDNGEELARVTRYFAAADALGIKVLVAFNHSRGDWRVCQKRSNRNMKICKLPSANSYKTNIKAFLDRFDPESVSAWNEINHQSQPTAKNPKAAAKFAKIADGLFRGPVVQGDFLDFKFSKTYAKKFRRALGKRPSLCGLHNYVDVNRNRTDGTRGMMKALKCKKYWWTETGGQYKGSNFSPSETRQANSTKRMFKLARKFKAQRVYNYSFMGSPQDIFDAGLINADTGVPRKAYSVFANGF
jgi:hypothetical protein